MQQTRRMRVLSSFLVLCSLFAALLAVPRAALAAAPVSDDFNRGNGGLGASWSAMSDGGLAIASQAVVGSTAAYSGNIRTGESYASDQSSQVQVTGRSSVVASGSGWCARPERWPELLRRLVLVELWQPGSDVVQAGERELDPARVYVCEWGVAAGTQLQLAVAGSTLTFSQNGVARVTATDTSLTGGAPAVMAYGKPAADNWQGTGSTTAVATYTVGGTVSGLSGTVVLQDNGGDDLTLSCQRRVHVRHALGRRCRPTWSRSRRNPAGQTCTVANGTGTITATNVTNASVIVHGHGDGDRLG